MSYVGHESPLQWLLSISNPSEYFLVIPTRNVYLPLIPKITQWVTTVCFSHSHLCQVIKSVQRVYRKCGIACFPPPPLNAKAGVPFPCTLSVLIGTSCTAFPGRRSSFQRSGSPRRTLAPPRGLSGARLLRVGTYPRRTEPARTNHWLSSWRPFARPRRWFALASGCLTIITPVTANSSAALNLGTCRLLKD